MSPRRACAGTRAVALLSPVQDGTDGFLIVYNRAYIRIIAGDHEGAVQDLERLLSTAGGPTIAELRMDPIYDSLRERTDFQALVN